MIDWDDFPERKKFYSRNGKGLWQVRWYRPALCLVEINTEEQCIFPFDDKETEKEFHEWPPGSIVTVTPAKQRFGRQSLLPRFFHRWWAKRNGYFWLLCPICHRPFGGHEQNPVDLQIDGHQGWMICLGPACTKEAQRRNRLRKMIATENTEKGVRDE